MGKPGTNKYPKMFNLGSPFKLDPNKRMDKLSAKHKELYDKFEMGQTSESEEAKMHRLEDRMDRVGKRIEKKKPSPASLTDPKKEFYVGKKPILTDAQKKKREENEKNRDPYSSRKK